jgi:aryl-alcohol dehydrogenase-like predicted oxidoreductase
LQYRPLGSSSIKVSAVGFGAWGIGGRTPGATSYGTTDDAVSARALNEAFDQGITFYDTASVYGNGHSEELIGECFRHRRHDVVIATKAGITASFLSYDFSPVALRASLEGSLRRLQTDYVDILQLHNAGPGVLRDHPDILDLASRLVADGKVRLFGVSTPSPQDALELLDVPGVACFQVNCNVLDWRAIDTGLFERAAARGIGVIARTPLAFGFLAGGLTKDSVFPADDHRSKWPRERVAAWVEAAEGVFAELGIADNPQSRVAAALRFCLSFEAVATVIPGMLSPAQVPASVAACEEGALDAGVMRCIEAVYRRYEARLKV